MRYLIAIIILISICLNCAHTRIASQINYKYSHKSYKKLFVIADFVDIEYKQAVEEKINYEANRKHIDCLISHEMSYLSNEEISELLINEDVDAVLVISPIASGATSFYIPPTTKTTTRGTVQKGFLGNYNFKAKSTTATSGGYEGTKPWTKVYAELYDFKSGDEVWEASASTGGNAWANFRTCLRSAGGKIIVKLDKDGFLYNKNSESE